MTDDILPTPEVKEPFICPHVPHTPARCYRRDGATIATTFDAVLQRSCVTCGLTTEQIDLLLSEQN